MVSSSGRGKWHKVNIGCLIAMVCFMFFFPLKKEIWYDESISILISKGLSGIAVGELPKLPHISSQAIESYNTNSRVFEATVLDNGNSYIYNICLHWFVSVFGNKLGTYLLFSEICAAAFLVAFFFMATLLLGDSLFVSLALLLLAFDPNIFGLGHEIRAYEMGVFFVTVAGVFFYKYMYQESKPRYLLFLGLFSTGAVLCHYLSACVILVFAAYLLFYKLKQIFKPIGLLALMVPIAIMCTYFAMAFSGFQHMALQNSAIKEKSSNEAFSFLEVVARSCSFTARNFRIFFPALNPNRLLSMGSFVFLTSIYYVVVKLARNTEMKRNLHLLFILGCSSTFFMALLSIKSQHYMSFYNRYFIFCIPFAVLFMVCALKVLFESESVKKILAVSALGVILAPYVFIYAKFFTKQHSAINYNHNRIADKVVSEKVEKLIVPDILDAMLVQCFIPQSFNLEYVVDSASKDFILNSGSGQVKVPCIRKENVK